MSGSAIRKSWFERNPKKTICFLLLVFLVASAFLTERILAYKAGGIGYRMGTRRYIKLRETEPLYSEALVPTAQMLRESDTLVNQPYLFRIDADGFIMPSRVHDHPDLTLVFLGGSTTELTYVDENNRFPYLTGHLLEKQLHLKVNSYNGAKSGNNSLNSIDILVNKVIPLKPDIVVMMHNVNDLSVLLYDRANSYWTTNPYRSPLISKPPDMKTVSKNFQEAFHIIRDLTIPNLAREYRNLAARWSAPVDEFAQIRGKQIDIDQPYLLKEFKMNLETFVRICRARKITPVLLTMASRLTEPPDPFILNNDMKVQTSQGISYHDYKEIFDLFNQAIREVGQADRVLVVDLAKEIPQEKEYLCDVVHFNDTGSKLAAAILSKEMAPAVRSLRSRPGMGN